MKMRNAKWEMRNAGKVALVTVVLISALSLAVLSVKSPAYGQTGTVTKSLTLNTNGVVILPTNFWQTNAAGITNVIGANYATAAQGALATSAVQPSSTNTLSNKTISGSSNTLTNIPSENLTGTIPAARLTSANLPNITLMLSGVLHTSPVTISGGSGTATLANQNANIIFSGPASGGAAAPTFRSLVAADLPLRHNDVEIAPTKTFSFEGATDDSNETTVTVVDPTADRTITLPNDSGTVALEKNYMSYISSDTTVVNNSTTLTNSGLSISLTSGKKYVIRGVVGFYIASNTCGTKFRLAFSGTSAGMAFETMVYVNNAGSWVDAGTKGVFGTTYSLNPGANISSATVIVNSTISATSDGNLTFQMAQVSAEAANMQIKSGSWLEVIRMN